MLVSKTNSEAKGVFTLFLSQFQNYLLLPFPTKIERSLAFSIPDRLTHSILLQESQHFYTSIFMCPEPAFP